MKNRFAHTENVGRFLAAYDRVAARSAREKAFMLVEGDPGRGKTCTGEWFAVQHDLPFIRAKREWTSRWMLRDLTDQLAAEPETSFEMLYRQVVKLLSVRAASAAAAGQPFAVLIDEADHLVRSERMMETLRDITDPAEVPVILIGMGRLKKNVTRYRQISSRVSAESEFVPLVVGDTAAILAARCEVPVEDDLVSHVHGVCAGFAREVVDCIGAIEAMGRRLGRAVSLADMEGQTLYVDRATGRAIIVRAA